jgi:hypothetical protein
MNAEPTNKLAAELNMTPQTLRCEFLTDPLGIDALPPLLSWVVSGTGPRPSRFAS